MTFTLIRLHDIRTGLTFDLTMSCILATVLKAKYASFASRVKDIVKTAFRRQTKLKRQISKECMDGLLWVIISSQLCICTMFLATRTEDESKGLSDSILKSIVKPWLDRGNNFVVEENGDSSHGISKSNIVRWWKEENNLKCYFNGASSPDLSPLTIAGCP